MHTVELVGAALAVLIGLSLVVRAFLPRPAMIDNVARARPRFRLRAQQLGLAHRFAARMIASPRRPRDEDFDWMERYTRDVDMSTIVLHAPGWASGVAQATPPLLELEELVERLERFTARLRSWRPGRRRERS